MDDLEIGGSVIEVEANNKESFDLLRMLLAALKKTSDEQIERGPWATRPGGKEGQES